MFAGLLGNFKVMAYFLGALALIQLGNIVLGSMAAIIGKEFDWKVFFNGFLKAILFTFALSLAVVALELFGEGMALIGMEIPEDALTFVEIIMILAVAFIHYGKDFKEKVMAFVNVTKEDVDDAFIKHEGDAEQLKG